MLLLLLLLCVMRNLSSGRRVDGTKLLRRMALTARACRESCQLFEVLKVQCQGHAVHGSDFLFSWFQLGLTHLTQ